MSINLKPEEVKLHGSISSVFYLTDDTAGYYIGAFALTNIGTRPQCQRQRIRVVPGGA